MIHLEPLPPRDLQPPSIEPEQVPIPFVQALNFIIPLMAIGLGFDSVNSEFNRRTLSRVLSQPIYRDALLLGKFLGGLVTLAVALVALWLIVFGAGLLLLGQPPRGVEVARALGFLVVAIAYGGVWLAVSMLFAWATGIVCLRTQGVYFIMITLAFGQMVFFTASSLAPYGGDDGLTIASRNTLFGLQLFKSDRAFYYVVLVCLTVTYLICRSIVQSRFGRVLRGGREISRLVSFSSPA